MRALSSMLAVELLALYTSSGSGDRARCSHPTSFVEDVVGAHGHEVSPTRLHADARLPRRRRDVVRNAGRSSHPATSWKAGAVDDRFRSLAATRACTARASAKSPRERPAGTTFHLPCRAHARTSVPSCPAAPGDEDSASTRAAELVVGSSRSERRSFQELTDPAPRSLSEMIAPRSTSSSNSRLSSDEHRDQSRSSESGDTALSIPGSTRPCRSTR